MENKSVFDSFELQFTSVAQGFLKEIAKWAFLLSIIGYIGIALMFVGGLAIFAVSTMSESAMGGMSSMGVMPAGAIAAVYIISAFLYFFPVYYLGKFASNAKSALSNNNTEQLTESLSNLKSHYKFIGILTIVSISFFLLLIIISIVAGIGAAVGM